MAGVQWRSTAAVKVDAKKFLEDSRILQKPPIDIAGEYVRLGCVW